MAVKNNRYAGIYDRITHEHICMGCYTEEDAKRLGIYLPVGGVVNDPCFCVRCGEPLNVTVLTQDDEAEDQAAAEARAKSGDARHLMDVLEREGYTVLSAGSVGQALEVLRHLRQ